MNLFEYVDYKPCCDGVNKVRFCRLEFDNNISIDELRKLTTDRDYLIFNGTIFTEDCYFHAYKNRKARKA